MLCNKHVSLSVCVLCHRRRHCLVAPLNLARGRQRTQTENPHTHTFIFSHIACACLATGSVLHGSEHTSFSNASAAVDVVVVSLPLVSGSSTLMYKSYVYVIITVRFPPERAGGGGRSRVAPFVFACGVRAD